MCFPSAEGLVGIQEEPDEPRDQEDTWSQYFTSTPNSWCHINITWCKLKIFQSLQEAITLMEKAELEERRLVSCAFPSQNTLGMAEKRQPPPAPILLSRTNRSMTFIPAPYTLETEVVKSFLKALLWHPSSTFWIYFLVFKCKCWRTSLHFDSGLGLLVQYLCKRSRRCQPKSTT